MSMSTRALPAKELARLLENHQRAGSPGVPHLYDPTMLADSKPVGYRPMTTHEQAIALRYIARAERQQHYYAVKAEADRRRAEREARDQRQREAEVLQARAREAIAVIVGASK